jgi:hypothetical protein
MVARSLHNSAISENRCNFLDNDQHFLDNRWGDLVIANNYCCRLRRFLRFSSRDFLGFSDFGRVGAARDLKKLWQTDLRPKIES